MFPLYSQTPQSLSAPLLAKIKGAASRPPGGCQLYSLAGKLHKSSRIIIMV